MGALRWWHWVLGAVVVLGVTGMLVEQPSDEERRRAKGEAARIVAAARAQATRVRDDARAEAERIVGDAEDRRDEARSALRVAQRRTSETRSRRSREAAKLSRLRREVASVERRIEMSSFPGDGTFVVGEDIAPGTYRAAAAGTNCYWARLSDLSKTGVESIIANENTSGPVVLQVLPGDVAVEVSGCRTFKKAG